MKYNLHTHDSISVYVSIRNLIHRKYNGKSKFWLQIFLFKAKIVSAITSPISPKNIKFLNEMKYNLDTHDSKYVGSYLSQKHNS